MAVLTKSSKKFHLQERESLAGYMFIAPSAVFLLVFLAIPIVASLVLIWTEYDMLTPPRFVGFANFARLFTDARLATVYRNTVFLVIGVTLLNNLLGFLLALAVNRPMNKVLSYLFRTGLFLPVITTTVSMAVTWRFLLASDRGVINWVLGTLGFDAVPWLASSQLSLVAVMFYDVWKTCGHAMVLYLAGLQGIPEHLYEAARVDGAGRWHLFRHVTLPLITPTAFYVFVMYIIGAFQIFDNAVVLTGGGPGDSSRTIAMYIYEKAFRLYEMGYASTISLTLFALLVTLTLIQFVLGRKWVFYE
jgi:multiple sugar transport system permease protein